MTAKALKISFDKLKNEIASLEAKVISYGDKKCKCPPSCNDRLKPKTNDKVSQTTNRPIVCPCKNSKATGETTDRSIRSAKGKNSIKSPRKDLETRNDQELVCCECNCPAKHGKVPFYLGTINPVPQVLPEVRTRSIGTVTTSRREKSKTIVGMSNDKEELNTIKKTDFTSARLKSAQMSQRDCPCSRRDVLDSVICNNVQKCRQYDKHRGASVQNDSLQSSLLKEKVMRLKNLKTVDKTNDKDTTWQEIITKKGESKSTKGKSGSIFNTRQIATMDKEGRSRDSQKAKDSEKILTKELEVKNVAIRNMQQLLDKHVKGEEFLRSLVSNLQDELEEAQEGRGRAKLEAMLKALEEEKLKVLLCGKDFVLDHIVRCNEELSEKLRKQRELDRNMAASLEVDKIMMSLKPQMIDLTTSSIGDYQPKIHSQRQTSTPTGSAASLEGFANESWEEISRIDHRRF